MEQPSMHTPRNGPHRPRRESTTVYRATPPRSAPRVLAALKRLQQIQRVSGPRLTGLGCGLFAVLTMLAVGTLDRLLLDASAVFYGLLFLLVCALCGLWVRSMDLLSAPISGPIAFAAGLLPLTAGSGGFGSQVMAMFTQLALQAGWLYGGTLTAGLVVGARKVVQLGSGAARRAQQDPPGGQQPPAERPQPERA
ncbi:DUF6542 domain-containing protein [Streptomyces sp. NPDC004647]|uniref:DUF6542 domain-containing protein n=1 Tax=Streptomyces sp. NPDC004647 TaxID=3154671 RepID=UPI0033AA2439